MIKNSFIFLDRINVRSEYNIWKQGISNWDDFIGTKKIEGISSARKIFYDRQLVIAKQKLKEYDASFFANKFPKSEVWRLYETFKHDAIFLDIETSGYYGDITVLGIYDGYDTKIMIKGKNLDNRLFTKVLLNKKLLITFNGFSFDVPMIKRYFQKSIPSLFQLPHFDLRFACARIGLNGGLKLIEQKLGIKRLDQVKSMRGGDAINLWHKYSSTGNSDYLEQLVKYNEEDIINLKPLAELVVKNLKRNYDNFFVKF